MHRRKQYSEISDKALKSVVTAQVRFSEVDSMRVVWHGNYARYFEDGRESFGRKYPGIGYMDIYENGFTAPIVDLTIQFLCPLTINDTAIIETYYIPDPAARLRFEYIIRRGSDNRISVRGSSAQVFISTDGEMSLNTPEFYQEWKRKWIQNQ